MEIMEIVLLVAGGIIFILSFLIPGGKEMASEQTRELTEKEVSAMVSDEMHKIKEHVSEVVDEAVGYATEKTERTLERLTNEKIMAVNEYSDTVLAEIHKNHEETMFLYDMLNNKHANLKDAVSEVNRTVKEAEEAVSGFRMLATEQQIMSEEALSEQTETNQLQEAVKEQESAMAGIGEETTEQDGTASETTADAGELQPERVSFLQENETDGRNSNERILELYRQGKSKVAIAKELGLGVGEVKLVIDLFKNQ